MQILKYYFHLNSSSRKNKVTDSSFDFADIMEQLADPANRYLLRPSSEILKGLASSLIYLRQEEAKSQILPTFHTKYFAEMVKKHMVVSASEILLETKDKIQSLETLAKMIKCTISIFHRVSSGLVRSSQGAIQSYEAQDLVSQIMQGNMDECYRIKTLINAKLGSFLVNSLQVAMGRMVDRVLRYVLLSANKIEMVKVFEAFTDRHYREEVLCKLLSTLLTLGQQTYKLADQLDILDNIDILQKLLRESTFLKAAGCNKKTILERNSTRQDSVPVRPEFLPLDHVNTLSRRKSLRKGIKMTDTATLTGVDSVPGLSAKPFESMSSPLIKWLSYSDIDDGMGQVSAISLLDTLLTTGLKRNNTQDKIDSIPAAEAIEDNTTFSDLVNKTLAAVSSLQGETCSILNLFINSHIV